MAINKVIYNNVTIIDLTNDTVTPEKLYSGTTAHSANGAVITGTASISYDEVNEILTIPTGMLEVIIDED